VHTLGYYNSKIKKTTAAVSQTQNIVDIGTPFQFLAFGNMTRRREVYSSVANDVARAFGRRRGYQPFVCFYRGDQPSTDALSSAEVKRLNRERNQLMAYLEDLGIAVRQGIHAVHRLGYYRTKYGLEPHDYPNSYAADRLSISLPLYAGSPKRRSIGSSPL
jgi:dTDP-4-amino-4,6-dideoxygalactose transaminase